MNQQTPLPDLDAGLDDLIRSLRSTAPNRVFAASYGGRRLWVKTVMRPRMRSSLLLQKAIATLSGLPILQPAFNPGGAAGLIAEAQTLGQLQAAGFPVPPVIGCTPDWLVLGDAGEDLEARLNSLRYTDPDECWRHITAAGRLLCRVHAAGHWHGGAQIRNFSWRDGQPGLLDLEDHDLAGMTLAEKQARDLMLFLYSLARYDAKSSGPPRLPVLAAEMLGNASNEVHDVLRKLRRRMAWLLSLARMVAPKAGRDVRQAVACDDALGAALR